MLFGEFKCTFLDIDKGNVVESHEAIVMKAVKIKPLKEEDSHKYLGQDKKFGYMGPLNKALVTSGYKKLGRKIWSSEISAYNKHITYTFIYIYVYHIYAYHLYI